MQVMHSNEKLTNNFFSGTNGVIVSTHYTQHIISFQKEDYTVTFNDKCTFNLITQSQEVAFDAIFCEKGKVLTNITGYTNRSLLTLQGILTGPY